MYKIKIDTEKNLILLRFLDKLDQVDILHKIIPEIFKKIHLLKRDFFVVTDLSKLKYIDHDCDEAVMNIYEFFIARGMQKEIRVLGTRKGPGVQFESITKKIKGYPVSQVCTMVEAVNIILSNK